MTGENGTESGGYDQSRVTNRATTAVETVTPGDKTRRVAKKIAGAFDAIRGRIPSSANLAVSAERAKPQGLTNVNREELPEKITKAIDTIDTFRIRTRLATTTGEDISDRVASHVSFLSEQAGVLTAGVEDPRYTSRIVNSLGLLYTMDGAPVEIKRFCADFIVAHLPVIEASLKSIPLFPTDPQDKWFREKVFPLRKIQELLEAEIASGRKDLIVPAMGYIQQTLQMNRVDSYGQGLHLDNLWFKIFDNSDENQKSTALQMVVDLIQNPANSRAYIDTFIRDCMNGFASYELEQYRKKDGTKSELYLSYLATLVHGILQKIGMGESDIDTITWDAVIGGPVNEYVRGNIRLVENVWQMISLERQRQGICKYLFSQYGITNFTRYPEDILINQFDDRENNEKPYGLLLYPKADYGGAFSQDKKVLQELFQQAAGFGYSLRIAECGTKKNVIRILNFVRHHYGSIHFAVVSGHGTVESIRLGKPRVVTENKDEKENEDKYQISLADILRVGVIREGVRALESAFIPNPTIILNSCSTGKEGGIAQNLSRVLLARVIGPDRPTSLESIQLRKVFSSKGVSLQFKVKYADSPGIDKTYIRGTAA